MATRTRILEIERCRSRPCDGGRTLFFVHRTSRRQDRYSFFQPADVPDFDGERARVEVEIAAGVWRVVRILEVLPKSTRPIAQPW